MFEFLLIVNLFLTIHFYINFRLIKYVHVNKNEKALVYNESKQKGHFEVSTIYFHGAVDEHGNPAKIKLIIFVEDEKLMYSDFDKQTQ